MDIRPSNKKIPRNIKIPGDKSITHRAIIFASLSHHKTKIHNPLLGEDTLNTVEIFKDLGVDVRIENSKILINGKGPRGLRRANKDLYCGNSGTTMRLLAGVLACQDFSSRLTGDESLEKRPMTRIINPLREIGADISGIDGRPPLTINKPKKALRPIVYEPEVASAQVKSAILLTNLYTDGESKVIEKIKTRDHTERIQAYFEASKDMDREIDVPGDISSAMYFIVDALIKGVELRLDNIGLNPTRIGALDLIIRSGGKIRIENKKLVNNEPRGDICVYPSSIDSMTINEEILPSLIDEVPILAALGLFAKSPSKFTGLGELRHKETDRLEAIYSELSKLGGKIDLKGDSITIYPSKLKRARVKDYGDHRMAMTLSILANNIEEGIYLEGGESVSVSFPNFYEYILE